MFKRKRSIGRYTRRTRQRRDSQQMHSRGRGSPAKKPMRIVSRPGRGRTVKAVPGKGRGVTVDVSSTMKSKSTDQDYEDADDEVNGELSGASDEDGVGATATVSVA